MNYLQEQGNQEILGENPQLGSILQMAQSCQFEGISQVGTGKPCMSIMSPQANVALPV